MMKTILIFTFSSLAIEAALCLSQDDGRYHSTLMCAPAVRCEDDGQYHATAPEPVVADLPKADNRPELWLFTADGEWCTWCNKVKEEIEPVFDDLPFRIVYKTEIPTWLDGHVETLPTAYWIVGKGGKTIKGWHGIKKLTECWLATMPRAQATKAAAQKPKIANAVFGPTWTEDGHNTTVHHLTGFHHVPHSVVDPYRHNPVALNQIHGAVHTGMVRY